MLPFQDLKINLSKYLNFLIENQYLIDIYFYCLKKTFNQKNRKVGMSILAFQDVCHTHNIATSACNTITDNFCPGYPRTTKMVIRFWENDGAKFSTVKANQDGSVVLDPQNKEITFPDEAQLQKFSQDVQACVSKLFDCLREEHLPITKERVITMLGDTVVKPQTEASSSFPK